MLPLTYCDDDDDGDVNDGNDDDDDDDEEEEEEEGEQEKAEEPVLDESFSGCQSSSQLCGEVNKYSAAIN